MSAGTPATPVVETIDDILNEIVDKVKRSDVDETMQTYRESLAILVKNGFTEPQACIIVSNLMYMTMKGA